VDVRTGDRFDGHFHDPQLRGPTVRAVVVRAATALM
jgi:hypothetical protein